MSGASRRSGRSGQGPDDDRHQIAVRMHCGAVWHLHPVDAEGIPEGQDGSAGSLVGAAREFPPVGFFLPVQDRSQ